MKIKTYQQAIKYLETFIKPVVFEKISQKEARMKDPLDRMRKFLGLLGNPQNQFRSILVGGTSGKGSTSYFISHILKTAGYKTGLTISPHLQKINERIQINGIQISDEDFVKLLNKVVPAIEKMRKGEILKPPKGISHFMAAQVQDDNYEPSYFEILIAIAFLYFVQQKVDVAVVEVGMGGVYDATNTLAPLVSVITNVSLDHTDILGKTVEKIAREKAGIIKGLVGDSNLLASELASGSNIHLSRKSKSPPSIRQNLIVITGVKQKLIIKIVEDKCKEAGAKLYRLGKDFNYEITEENINGSNFNFKNLENLQNIHLSTIGEYQIQNASLAIKTVLELQKFRFKISEQNIRIALSTSFFQGRFEIINLNNKSTGRLSHVANDARRVLNVHSNLSLSSLNESRLPKLINNSDIKTESAFNSFASEKPPIASMNRKNFESSPRQNNSQLSTLPLRSEASNSQLVLDGAHNPAKMKAFLSSLKKIFPRQNPTSSSFAGLRGTKKVFIVAFKDDKDVKGMLKEIIKIADTIIVTEFHRTLEVKGHASMNRSKIRDQILKIIDGKENTILYANDSREALQKAIEISCISHSEFISESQDSLKEIPKQVRDDMNKNFKSLILVTGSLYLVGEIRNQITER